MGHQLQLVNVILPEVSGSYGKIKRICETVVEIVSQCCLPKHTGRPNKLYIENVALKINVKVGGCNTVFERTFVQNGIPFVSIVPTIIFCADVPHPLPGEDSASSISAVVASMDWPEITKHRGLVSAEPHRQEIIEDLFKDPVTVVVVPKRHHTRLFLEVHVMRDMIDKSGNILPGTVVDSEICQLTDFNFYLCSHAGIQVISRPTHYHVLYDENHFIADPLPLQSLTNNLYCTYACCTRAVSVGENSGQCSILGSSGQAAVAQEGSLAASTGAQTIQVDVVLPHRSVNLPVKKSDSVESVVAAAMISEGIWITDCYYTCGGRTLGNDTTIGNSNVYEGSKINVNVRMRGGREIESSVASCSRVPNINPEPLCNYIQNLKDQKKWFEIVSVPASLRKSKQDYVIVLAKDARATLTMLLECLEKMHSIGLCFCGNFSISDIYYHPLYRILIIDTQKYTLKDLDYKKDLLRVVTIVNNHFRYEDSGQRIYPMYVKNMVQRIKKLQIESSGCYDVDKRSLIWNHPCTWTSFRRIIIYPSLVIHFNSLSQDNKNQFRRALNPSNERPLKWMRDVNSAASPQAMKCCFNYGGYYDDNNQWVPSTYCPGVFSRLNFSRCFVTHYTSDQTIENQIDASLFLLWPGQLPDIHKKLIVDYKPQSKESLKVLDEIFGTSK